MEPSERQLTMPDTPTRQRWRPRIVMVYALIGALVIVLSSLAIVHYSGPPATVRTYLSDLLEKQDAKSGYGMLCNSTRSQISLDQVQAIVDENRALAPIHLAGLTYTLLDENFFGDAHVRVSGKITFSFNGNIQNTPIPAAAKPITVRTAGLGWCLTESFFSTSAGLSALVSLGETS